MIDCDANDEGVFDCDCDCDARCYLRGIDLRALRRNQYIFLIPHLSFLLDWLEGERIGDWRTILLSRMMPMKKRHIAAGSDRRSSSNNDKDHTNFDHDDDQERKYKQTFFFWSNRRKTCMLAMLSLILIIVAQRIITTGAIFGSSTSAAVISDLSRYGAPTNTTNNFISRFEDVLLHDIGHDFFVPLILDTDGKLLCRKKHKQQLSRYRTRFFAQMVRRGITLQNNHSSIKIEDGLPLLIMDVDGNGCNVHHHRDDYKFPRLSWSVLSPKHNGWTCEAIGMPSYETWKYYHRSHKIEQHWEQTFQLNERTYPWSTKINKAVWRGSTTYEGSQYHNSELGETPRGQLVSKSMEYPELIDAGFHKINQKFNEQKHDLKGQFTVKQRMNPKEMMKYKGMLLEWLVCYVLFRNSLF